MHDSIIKKYKDMTNVFVHFKKLKSWNQNYIYTITGDLIYDNNNNLYLKKKIFTIQPNMPEYRKSVNRFIWWILIHYTSESYFNKKSSHLFYCSNEDVAKQILNYCFSLLGKIIRKKTR